MVRIIITQVRGMPQERNSVDKIEVETQRVLVLHGQSVSGAKERLAQGPALLHSRDTAESAQRQRVVSSSDSLPEA